jgi:hypothetical protein
MDKAALAPQRRDETGREEGGRFHREKLPAEIDGAKMGLRFGLRAEAWSSLRWFFTR